MKTFTTITTILVLGASLGLASSDTFQYPISNWDYVRQGGFGFGAYNGYFGGYHLAQDTNVSRTPVGTVVYAPSDGIVKFAGLAGGYGSSACYGHGGKAGYVVIIEHTLKNGRRVCSTLGHLRGGPYNPINNTGLIRRGSMVYRGQYIGRVEHYGGCPSGDWHHLHFGIRKGRYLGAPNIRGYGSRTELYNWYEPNSFVRARLGNDRTFWDIKKAGDFNGDGRKDFVRYYPGIASWKVALSTGRDFARLTTWKTNFGVGSNGQYVGDINGDGRSDIGVLSESSGNLYFALSTGHSFGPFYVAARHTGQRMTNKFLADINGDRREDFVGFVNGELWVALSYGQYFGPWHRVMAGFGRGSTRRLMADVNGDHRMDMVVFYNYNGKWYVTYGQPNGTFAGVRRMAVGHGYGSSEQFLGDVNGDGKADAICFWHRLGRQYGVWIVWNSNGTSFIHDNRRRLINAGYHSAKRLIGDYSGDRRADIGYYYYTSGWFVSTSRGYYFNAGRPW